MHHSQRFEANLQVWVAEEVTKYVATHSHLRTVVDAASAHDDRLDDFTGWLIRRYRPDLLDAQLQTPAARLEQSYTDQTMDQAHRIRALSELATELLDALETVPGQPEGVVAAYRKQIRTLADR